MDYLQHTTHPTTQANVITQVLPMAAPPVPPIPKHSSQHSSHIQLLELDSIQTPSSSEHQTARSSSAPADFMITSTSPASSSFLGTFASASIFDSSSLQQSQQQTPSFTGGRPRHHTTTNVLSLQSMSSSQQSQDFMGGEVQRELNPFDGSSNC